MRGRSLRPKCPVTHPGQGGRPVSKRGVGWGLAKLVLNLLNQGGKHSNPSKKHDAKNAKKRKKCKKNNTNKRYFKNQAQRRGRVF